MITTAAASTPTAATLPATGSVEVLPLALVLSVLGLLLRRLA